MPTIYIDDQPYEVPEGDNVLQACLSAGLDLPYFCWHPAMGSVGACRQCALVQFRDEQDTQGRIVMGCMTPVAEGARFSMQGPDASEFRSKIIQSLMLNHPHDCPVCAEGGECHLQDMTVMVGHRKRSYRGRKNTHRNQYLGPLVHHEMNRCIACYRCTRYYNDYAGGTDLAAQGAHDHVYFGRQQDGVLESEFAGNLVEVCPTGVFTDKPLVNDYTRKWDLQSAPSVCVGCALGCNTSVGERYGKLKRIHNRYNTEVNNYFLCDRGRYGGNFVNDESRPLFAGLRNQQQRYDAIEQQQALDTLAEWCGTGRRVAAIGSPRASLESNYLLRRLVGVENFNSGMADHEAALLSQVHGLLASNGVVTPSLQQVEHADAVFILGEDVTNTAPRLALALRQSVRSKAFELAAELKIPVWQDEAVRVLAQQQRSPLHIVAMSDTRLDDVAASTAAHSPDDIARLGYAVAAALDNSLPAIEDLASDLQSRAQQIADDLRSASRPLVISGTASQSAAVIDAAAAIARALSQTDKMLSFCLPEANSLGVAMLADAQQPSFSELTRRSNNGEIDTLLVLENDLYRRAPQSSVEALLKNAGKVVVLDCVDTATMSCSALALPTASFAEAEGTLVSSEARAQRYYPAFLPAEQRQPAWQWLKQMGQQLQPARFDPLPHFDDITAACAADCPALSRIAEAGPNAGFRIRGLKVPRQPHRYSGRTAMLSNHNVHEPKQPVDEDTPLAFTMEGASGARPGALLPFVWAPGWNSNQSVHKFQSRVGGPVSGGTAGVRLIEPQQEVSHSVLPPQPVFTASDAVLWLLPLHRIFGSDELSARAPAVAELVSQPFIQLNTTSAHRLNLNEGDYAILSWADTRCEVQVQINDAIPDGCAGYGMDLPGAAWLPPDTHASITAADGGSDV
ncbi:MAG: NADH-quinone oxidoreductase subunit NuoG [Gammaproteobacteria bacterium]|nr:NADH-quinone oxidoreductase subunit NuoG [Gammaproteobacteria bacterium]